MKLEETKLSSTEIFDGVAIHLFRDEILLPNGNKGVREVVRHPGAVCVIPITDNGEIIFVNQFRYAFNKVTLEIPAGKLDHGENEDPLECAKRELSEETGYDAANWQKLISIATTPGFSDEIIHLYKAWGLTAHSQHTDEDEFIGVQAFTPEQVKTMILNGELYDAKTLCALYACGLIEK